MSFEFDAGSYRDPSGQVFGHQGRIFRTVMPRAADSFRKVWDSGILNDPEISRHLVPTKQHDDLGWCAELDAALILEHEKIPFVSYPYEWSFWQLKDAALCHLELQMELLDRGFCLSDASAYNVQFLGSTPRFIDILSIRPYVEGEFWLGHRQFCEQFLNPLLLRALAGVPHNAWYRGSLEGISAQDLDRVLPLSRKMSLNVLTHVSLQARMARSSTSAPDKALEKAKTARRLNKSGYKALLAQLHRWIKRLEPASDGKSVWGSYATDNTYTDAESAAKADAIKRFAAQAQPRLLIDLGCNTGNFSKAALAGGADYVVGFDFDQNAVDAAYRSARADNLPFLPLWLDASNPSPDQGWDQGERKGFARRVKADAVIALAFEHHLAIAKNIPLPSVVRWITDMAPRGIIEFVPKDDPTIRTMLALREDIFPDYTQSDFASALARVATITATDVVSSSGRTLFTFEKPA